VHYLEFSAGVMGSAQDGPWSFDGGSTATFGVRGLVNHEDQFAYKRYQAHGDFFYLRGQMRLTRALPWSTAATFRAAGQWAPDPLIANEQFSLGGVDTVRGYLEAEVLADMAAAASLELSTPRWASSADPARAFAVTGLIFVDAGIARQERPLPGEDAQSHLASYGLGLLLAGPWDLSGLFDLARTMSAGTRTMLHDTRVHFMLRMGF